MTPDTTIFLVGDSQSYLIIIWKLSYVNTCALVIRTRKTYFKSMVNRFHIFAFGKERTLLPTHLRFFKLLQANYKFIKLSKVDYNSIFESESCGVCTKSI